MSYLYAIVLQLAALQRGAIPKDHGDQARGALLNLIRMGDAPFAARLHDANDHKPYTISLLHGTKRGRDGALHFGEGDLAEWRFTLMADPAFEAMLQRYVHDRALPHLRIGVIPFAVTDVFASKAHPDSGVISLADLTERWNRPPDTLPRTFDLEFRSPTVFNLGTDKVTGRRIWLSVPEGRTLFSTLRHRWRKMGGVTPDDSFDAWVEACVRVTPKTMTLERVLIEGVGRTGFQGMVTVEVRGTDIAPLPFLHLLVDLGFWTGVGNQTTQGLGQMRRLINTE